MTFDLDMQCHPWHGHPYRQFCWFCCCCCALAYMPKYPQRDFFASVTDLAGSRESWFRDTSVDPKRCSRVAASAGHSMSQCSKVCWPSPHSGHVRSTKGSMTCLYARSRLLWLEWSSASVMASFQLEISTLSLRSLYWSYYTALVLSWVDAVSLISCCH